jgi:hypothetical protein
MKKVNHKFISKFVFTLYDAQSQVFTCSYCSTSCHDVGGIKKHLFQCHLDTISELDFEQKPNSFSELVGRRNKKGSSDPVELACNCHSKGTILLFYNYVEIKEPQELAKNLQSLGRDIDIHGKIRVGSEGFNITIGGSNDAANVFMDYFINCQLLPGIENLDESELKRFKTLYFKPSKGCKHGNRIFIQLSNL